MVFLEDIQLTVQNAYVALADIQYHISVKEPISGDIKYFNGPYAMSTKLVANLEYLNSMELGMTHEENMEIESILFSLKEIISKIKSTWL